MMRKKYKNVTALPYPLSCFAGFAKGVDSCFITPSPFGPYGAIGEACSAKQGEEHLNITVNRETPY